MKYGLIGGSLSHSLSPKIHKLMGIENYELNEMTESEAEIFFEEKNFIGINITNPFKKTAYKKADILSDKAKKTGAVNTIHNDGGKLLGYNTDWQGFSSLLSYFEISKDETFLIFGNGAVSSTIKEVLYEFGAKKIKQVARNLEHDFDDIDYTKDATVVINALPIGIFPLSLKALAKVHSVIDVNYSPFPSFLLREALFLKKRAISGLYMLVSQALVSSNIFKGKNNSNKIVEDTEAIEAIYIKLKKELISKKILVINGPNLNLLGIREPNLYGTKTYEELGKFLHDKALEENIELEVFQSNHEGDIIDKIQEARGNFSGLVINAAAYSHTSLAIYDAIKAVNLPIVEVHLTDPSNREDYRKFSYISKASEQIFKGKGFESYGEALEYFSGRNCL